MHMVDFLQTSLDGILIGATYGIIGLGFAVIFVVLKRFNLAYGSCLLFGAALAVWVEQQLALGPVGLVLVTIIGSMLACVYVEKLCFAPHVGRHAVNASMIASFAIWMQLDEISSMLLPQRTHSYEGISITVIELGPFIIRTEQLLILLAAFLVMIALYIFVFRSRFGVSIKAVTEDVSLAKTLGLHVKLVSVTIFLLAGFIGGIGAFMVLSSDGQVTPLFGLWATFKGLVVVMIGGLSSPVGAFAGGIILGVLETHTAYIFGAEYRDIMTFGLLFLVLIFKPSGLFATDIYRTELMSKERL